MEFGVKKIFQKTLILVLEKIMRNHSNTHLKLNFFFRVLAYCVKKEKPKPINIEKAKQHLSMTDEYF